ncbi:hypothetical protein ACRAWC_20835 [Leifsonia sp. L25]|uniref:hypothetical protein n=1 Tax=Leifsonia sp. L25 TaxID=3423957 RepID=UPI003D69AE58
MAHTLTGDADLFLPEFDDPARRAGACSTSGSAARRSEGVREALAATLATTGEGGAPDARTVALRRLTADGVEFGTSSDSGKGASSPPTRAPPWCCTGASSCSSCG